MPPKQNNPAARLHRILSLLCNQPANTRLLDAWRAIFIRTIPVNDNNFGFLRRYGQFLALPKCARDSLFSVKNRNPELYSKWIPQLEAALAGTSLSGQVGSFTATFDKFALQDLEYCADRLSLDEDLAEATVDPTELDKIARDAKQLRSETEAAEMDGDLKSYIQDCLDNIISAIEDYDLEGIVSLEHGIERAFGSLVRNRDQSIKLKEHSIGKRLGQILCALSMAVNVASGVLEMPHHVHQFLIEVGLIDQRQLTDQRHSPALQTLV